MQRKLEQIKYAVAGTLATVLGDHFKPPFFIIGTGRCGTTLLVNILNTHSDLLGYPGEANELWHPNSYPYSKKSIDTVPIVENPRQFTDISIQNWPTQHEQKIQKRFEGYNFAKGSKQTLFIKSAMISFMIPKLRTLFPDSKFIHIYRNGPSVVESFLKKEWGKYASYFDSQDVYRHHCANYWNECLLEIERQRVEMSLNEEVLFEFSYEYLCERPTECLNKLATFLEINSEVFKFDTTQIVSQNYKVGNYAEDDDWDALLQMMSEGMKLKGYM